MSVAFNVVADIALAATGVVLMPALAVGVAMEQVALQLGWSPGRLRNFALASLAVPAVSMLAEGSPAGPLLAAWRAGHEVVDGQIAAGMVDSAALYIPLGMALSVGWWSAYRTRAKTGKARTLAAGQRHLVNHQARQQANVLRRARRNYPLTTEAGDLVLGPLLEENDGVPRGAFAELVARHPEVMTLPLDAVKKHLVLVGNTGSGKTTLLHRLGAATLEAAWREYQQGTAGRPLLIFADCKGGPKSIEDGQRFCDEVIDAGLHPSRVGLWPTEDRLDIWGLPAADLHELLDGLIAASNAYYDELRELALHLVVGAPGGTPTSSADFLRRFDPAWLRRAWAGHSVELSGLETLTNGHDEALPTAALRYMNLFRKLGRMLDAGRDLADFDAVYASVDGVRRPKEAQAQAAVIIRMVTELLTRPDHGRQVFLVVDEYSAVAGGGQMTSLVGLAERIRSLGGCLIASSQTWEGLGPDDDQRRRLVGACSGGRLLMRSPSPEDLAKLSGTVKVQEASRHISTDESMSEGSERLQDTWLVNPDRVRRLGLGDLVHAVDGRAQWGHVVPVGRRAKQLDAGVGREALPPAPRYDRVPLAKLEADVDAAIRQLTAKIGGGDQGAAPMSGGGGRDERSACGPVARGAGRAGRGSDGAWSGHRGD